MKITEKLFTDEGGYTEKALLIENEFEKMLTPVLEKLVDQGFSIRELAYLANGAVTSSHLMIALFKE